MKYRVWTLIGVLALAALACLPASSPAQDFSKAIAGDNSDWWSIVRRIESPNDHIEPQEREPAPSNSHVLGISLEYENLFKKAAEKLGPAKLIDRGDAATARQQACYVSIGESPKTYLIFETGEVQLSSIYSPRAGRGMDRNIAPSRRS